MNNTQSWVEALNISPEMLAEWSSQAPAGKPLLVHCLEEGHLSVPEYLQWASDHFGLAVLSSSYFQEALDMSALAHHRDGGQWQPWCFPVDQWDDVTFVACVEPPVEPENEKIRYVLADPRAMKEVWGEPSPAPALESFDIPDGIKLSTTKPFVLNIDESQFLTPPSEPSVPPPPQAQEETPPPAPGLLFSENSEVSHVPIHAVSEKNSRGNFNTQVAQGEASSPSISVVRAKAGSVATGGKLNLPVNENAACAAVFDALNAKYSNSFIMKCTDADTHLYKWDAGLNPSETALTSINLGLPTFFRIVAKTLLPYHGYLIDSPAHREFFSAIGLKEIPPCVTAIPLKFNGSLWGILVAVGPRELQTLETLHEAEALCEQLIKTVGAIWGQAA